MARTIQDIYQSLLAAKTARGELDTLTSTSDTALWRLWLNVVATGMHLLELHFDRHQAEVEALAARARAGTLSWYADQLRAFQPGDLLTVVDGRPGYAVIDPTKQIVAYVTIREVGLGLVARVAKRVGGVPTPLNAITELAPLAVYLSRVKFAGTFTTLLSEPPDVLRIPAAVYVDALLFGTGVQAAVEAAITACVANMGFGGRLPLSAIEDAIQAVPGVQDVVLGAVAGRPASGSYGAAAVRYYEPQAGYAKIDTLTGNTLADTITYYLQ